MCVKGKAVVGGGMGCRLVGGCIAGEWPWGKGRQRLARSVSGGSGGLVWDGAPRGGNTGASLGA